MIPMRLLFCLFCVSFASSLWSTRTYATVTIGLEDVRVQAGEDAFVNVLVFSDTAGEQLSISSFDIVLTISQVSGPNEGGSTLADFDLSASSGVENAIGASDIGLSTSQAFETSTAEFTLAETDADLSGEANYVFAGLETNPLTIGDTEADPLRVGRSDFTLDTIAPRSGPLLLGRFQVITDATAGPAVFQVGLEDVNGTTAVFDENFDPISISGFTGGTLTVAAVPEPSGVTFLFVAGFVGAQLRRKRRR